MCNVAGRCTLNREGGGPKDRILCLNFLFCLKILFRHYVFIFKTLLLFIFKIFIYFWLCWVFIAACGLSLVAASKGYSSLQCVGFSLRWLLLLQSTGSRNVGFSSCGMWAPQLWCADSRAQAQQLWHTGLVAPGRVGSSRTRDRTCVPCSGRQILTVPPGKSQNNCFLK